MARTKNKFVEPVEQLTVEDDVLVVSLSGKLFNSVGHIETLDLPEEGSEIGAGDDLVIINGTDDDLHLRAPISGTILEVNDLFQEEITKFEGDSEHYEWVVKIEPQDPEDLLKFED